MTEYLFMIIAALAAIALPLIGMMVVISLADLNKNRKNGFLHFAPYAILLAAAADILFSGRSLDNVSELLRATAERSSANMWIVRLVTVFLLLASLERILAAARINRHLLGAKPVLTWSFGLFWLGSVGLNLSVSAHPYFSHEYFYSLVLGLGVLSLTPDESNKFILAFRNGLVLFLVASFLMLLIKPYLVLESGYSQGYIPGLPRLSGLAAHAVTLGQLALLSGLLLVMCPIKNRWLQRITIVMALVALFMAQSKTAWISAIVCFSVMFWYKYKLSLNNSPQLKQRVALPLLAFTFLSLGLVVAYFAYAGLDVAMERFFSSSEGSQLTSMTGRDVIWDFALTEWSKYPIFGYGAQFLNFEQRVSIGMLNATHAHNQFVDLLARSGLVGLLSVLPYLAVIWAMVRKVNLAYKGIAAAFFMAVLIRCVSEVPLVLYGYGVELLMQLSLLAILLMAQQNAIATPAETNSPPVRGML